MARKKAKKKTKKRVKKVKKVKRAKKAKRPKAKRPKAQRPKVEAKEKVLGIVDHFFGNISVAAIKVKAPIKVGDVIHIKGHTTDFVQKIDSMQIEHQNVIKAKKGDDIGIKVKEKVRDHDIVFLAAKEKGITAQPIFSKPSVQPTPPPAPPQRSEKSDPYGDVKFLRF